MSQQTEPNTITVRNRWLHKFITSRKTSYCNRSWTAIQWWRCIRERRWTEWCPEECRFDLHNDHSDYCRCLFIDCNSFCHHIRSTTGMCIKKWADPKTSQWQIIEKHNRQKIWITNDPTPHLYPYHPLIHTQTPTPNNAKNIKEKKMIFLYSYTYLPIYLNQQRNSYRSHTNVKYNKLSKGKRSSGSGGTTTLAIPSGDDGDSEPMMGLTLNFSDDDEDDEQNGNEITFYASTWEKI